MQHPRATACRLRHRVAKGEVWFYRTRSFFTQARGPIRTFRCKHCRKSCSTQTFSTLYWMHSGGNLEHLENRLVSSDSLRQIGRDCGCSYRPLRDRIQRLVRRYLALFAVALTSTVTEEDRVFDGFESYIVSRFLPKNRHTLVAANSPAICGSDATLLERMGRHGRMTRNQEEMRAIVDAVWCPEQGVPREAVRRFFTDIVPVIKRTIERGRIHRHYLGEGHEPHRREDLLGREALDHRRAGE